MLSAWKAESQRRQEEREAKAAAAEAEAAAPEAGAATATAAEGAATGAEGAATEAPEAATGAPHGAPPAGAPAVVWVVGQIVKVKFGSGSNMMNGKKAKITGVLASHCHVEFIEGEALGISKKVTKANLTLAQEEATLPLAEAETLEAADDATSATGGTDTVDAWQNAEDVF